MRCFINCLLEGSFSWPKQPRVVIFVTAFFLGARILSFFAIAPSFVKLDRAQSPGVYVEESVAESVHLEKHERRVENVRQIVLQKLLIS